MSQDLDVIRTKAKAALKTLSPHAIVSMRKRGWTQQEIVEAIEYGIAYSAVDKTAGGQPATRFEHPDLRKSIVVNNQTGEVFHVGKQGFRYDRP